MLLLQILYLIAFTVVAIFAIRNLVGNVLTIGREQRQIKRRSPRVMSQPDHPELVDKEGNFIDEPLLVIRSTSLEEARNRLDEIYRESPDDPD